MEITLESAQEFASLWKQFGGNAVLVGRALGVSSRGLYARRRRVEAKLGITLPASRAQRHKGISAHEMDAVAARTTKQRELLNLPNGTVVVFSDCHYWPGEPSVGHRALLRVLTDLKPDVVIANGDLADFARLCRQDPAGWISPEVPSIGAELSILKTRLGEVWRASKGAKRFRTRGNHDSRFDRYLQMNADAMSEVAGFTLASHLPDWPESWSIDLNPDTHGWTRIKHRWHNGVHATYNNTLKGGVSIVTGHLHRLQVTCWGDVRGRRYGVDTGTLTDPHGPQFDYGEDNPTPHCQGFAVLTYHNSRLLMPELCHIEGGTPYFRGSRISI